jgi:AsmA protein
MQKAKILGGLIGGFLTLLCAALFALWLWVNPNNYKDRLAASIKQATGRDLRMPGDIKLTVFPWIALELGPASVVNPPGFSDEPFLLFSHASLRVKLLPLLRRRLEVTRVEIDDLNLRLSKNPDGRGNWQDVETIPVLSTPIGSDRTRMPHSLGWLADVRVHRGRVSYQHLSVENLELETGSVAPNQEIPMVISFTANRGIAGERISVNAKFDLKEASVQQPMQFAALNLSGTVSRPGDSRTGHWDLAAPTLEVNPQQQALQAPAFTFNYLGARLTGNVRATKILDDMSMTGSATLMPLVLQEFVPRIGIVIPKTQDPKVLLLLSATTDFAYELNALSLRNLQAHLDDTQFQGNIKFSVGESGPLAFDLAADQIDLDRYRAPEGRAIGNDPSLPDQPSQPAKALQVGGTLTVASARFSRMDFTNLRVTVASKDSVTHLFPAEAQIDGGRYSGDMILDNRGAVPVLSINEHFTGVDMVRLLSNSAQKGRVSGRANLNLKGSARGTTVDTLLKTLSGHLDADLVEGAFEGIDVGYEIDRAQALIDRARMPRDNTGHTTFDVFKTSAQIVNGIAETQDLTISSQALRVIGHGTANLATKAINFQLMASILKSPATSLVDIPLKVSGTYTDPAVKPDIDAVVKGQLKQKLQDVLKRNGLQGLFGK